MKVEPILRCSLCTNDFAYKPKIILNFSNYKQISYRSQNEHMLLIDVYV